MKEREDRITALHQDIAVHEGRIAGLLVANSGLQSVVKEHEGRIAELLAVNSSLQSVVKEHEGLIAELLATISSIQSVLMERDDQITNLHQAIAEREGVIAELFNSSSWKITQPLRIVSHQMKRAQRLARAILRDGSREDKT